MLQENDTKKNIYLPEDIIESLRQYNDVFTAEMNAEDILRDFFKQKQGISSEYTLEARVDVLEKLNEMVDTILIHHPSGRINLTQLKNTIKSILKNADYRSIAKYVDYFTAYAKYDTGKSFTYYSQIDVTGFKIVIETALNERLEKKARR